MVLAVRSPVDERLLEVLAETGAFAPVVRHVLAQPGKRIRSQMLLAACRVRGSAGGLPPYAVDLACGVELIHEASLIHDDICDGSVERRGQPSVPAAFGIRHAALSGFYLAGVAIELAGNALRSLRGPDAVALRPSAAERFASVGALSLGQLLEYASTTALPDLGERYARVAVAKTGSLFRLACALGGEIAGCDDAQLGALDDYAVNIALAYQIIDDVRDVEGPASLGKPRGTDVQRGVLSWPVIDFVTRRRGARAGHAADGELSCDQVELEGCTRRARAEALKHASAAVEALHKFEPEHAHTLALIGTQIVAV